MKYDTKSDNAIRVAARLTLIGAATLALASCVSSGPKVSVVKKSKPTEYFAESLVGVKASPRVVNVATALSPSGQMKRLPRGGGRDMVGKPYKVRGKWYYPKEIENYQMVGTASWYGDAFHGRLTANGEIYDMNHLSAAHPTMPLPSYARVTNLKNGKSVIVRINDRGPYAHNRMIDLSKRAAQLLDYTKTGTAQVKMEYIGRAPVHGKDDEYLLASYRDGDAGNGAVMVASNDAAGTSQVQPALAGVASVAFAPENPASTSAQISSDTMGDEGFVLEDSEIRGALPAVAPVLVNRPATCVTLEPCSDSNGEGLLNGYAPTKHNSKDAFAALDVSRDSADNWKEDNISERVLLGSFTAANAKLLQGRLKGLAQLTIESSKDVTVEVYALPVKGLSMDDLVRSLWKKGLTDAFVVRQ